MTQKTKNKKTVLFVSILIAVFVLSFTTPQIITTSNSSKTSNTTNTTPIGSPGEKPIEVKQLPNYPAFIGDGTSRICQESLWGYLDLGIRTADYSFTVDLPGTTQWYGTRLDVSVGDISETKDWITNGIFAGSLSPWVANNAGNPDITLGVNTLHGDAGRGDAAAFKFISHTNTCPTAPQWSSEDPDNTGDVGASTHWDSTQSGQANAATWYNRQNGAYNANFLGGANRAGAWEFYVEDTRNGATDTYEINFYANYSFTFNSFPIDENSLFFEFWSKWWTNDFDDGGHSCGGDPEGYEYFALYYCITDPIGDPWGTNALGWVKIFDHGPVGSGTDYYGPGDVANDYWGRTLLTYTNQQLKDVFARKLGGTYRVAFRAVVDMDVDDWHSEDCDNWGCNCNEGSDSDKLRLLIDGVEFSFKGTTSFSAVSPSIKLSDSAFRYRAPWTGELEFDIKVPTDFFCGIGDSNIYLRVIINNRTTGLQLHDYQLSTAFTRDIWVPDVKIEWLGGGLWRDFDGVYARPGTLTVQFLLDIPSGWYAKNDVQYLWIDNVQLNIQCIVDANKAGLQFLDDADHGSVAIPWSFVSEGANSITHMAGSPADRWQVSGNPSTFTFDKTTTASIVLYNVKFWLYCTPNYPSLKPTFSIATDADGRMDTVTWIMTHSIPSIYSSSGAINLWHYNLSIPSIPNWSGSDWDVVSILDANSAPVFWQERPYGAPNSFKNISIYENDKTAIAQGTWTITCTSPNRITSFNVVNGNDNTAWEYYPGFANRSRIKFYTGQLKSSSANISIMYLTPSGAPVMTPQYFNNSILANTDYTAAGRTPYWNIPADADPSSSYVTMVKWVDNGAGFIDEIGYAAHYVQVKRNITVSAANFLKLPVGPNTQYIFAGENLRIGINLNDPLGISTIPFDKANITFYYPSRINPFQTSSTTLNLLKFGDVYRYDLDTAGDEWDNWVINNAWMGMTGNRSFVIRLYGDSMYINGSYQYYELKGWFHIMVGTDFSEKKVENADDPGQGSTQEQGQNLLLTTSLVDVVWGHQDAQTGLSYTSLINNRTAGTPIADFYPREGKPDTWNGTVNLQWALIQQNLSSWCGPSGDPNLEEYIWNGTLTQVEGSRNSYNTMIKIPNDAYTSAARGYYYINVTAAFNQNEWGWLSKSLTTILSFRVVEASGFPTALQLDPDSSQEYYWKNSSQALTRWWVRYYNQTNGLGFNSTTLSKVTSWYVKSWVQGYFSGLPADIFGRSWAPIYWNLCANGTKLPDGTPDPHAENPVNNYTWGWFYHDFNWTQVKLQPGTFLEPAGKQELRIYVMADITNETEYQKAGSTFINYIKPNKVELNILLQYQGNPTFLDANYYGINNMTEAYYWGDIFNFTLNARDTIENKFQSNVVLRYHIKKDLSTFTVYGWINETGILGIYSTLLNTSDSSIGLTAGSYEIWFEGIKEDYSIQIEHKYFTLNKRDTHLRPEKIAGVFLAADIGGYQYIGDIMNIYQNKPFNPATEFFRTVPNMTIYMNISLLDDTKRNGGIIYDAEIYWILKDSYGIVRMAGWVNTSNNGIFNINVDLQDLDFQLNEFESRFYLIITPYKENYDSEHEGHAWWSLETTIGKRPIALIPITPPSMTYSQSNWQNHPIQFVAMDLISRENISGCTINWRILGTEYEGVYMDAVPGQPGYYEVTFDTWPSLFSWIPGGQYLLEAEIVNVPGGLYGISSTPGWQIPNLHGLNRIVLNVESEGFLGPLSMYFYIVLGIVGAVLGAYYSYKSYKFLTTPYVIRKIEESVDKISKDKKIAAGVMKSRDHLVFLEATELLSVVGVALKPPPEKKLPPPIEKIIKPVEEKAEKIPEIPMEVVEAELDKVGVRPEEKPILIQQIKELAAQDKREFIEGLIGEQRYKEIIEDLKGKGTIAKKG